MDDNIRQMLLVFSSVYPNFPKVTELTIVTWAKLLGAYPDDVLSEAMDTYILESRVCPTIADINALAFKINQTRPVKENIETQVDYSEMNPEDWWGENK